MIGPSSMFAALFDLDGTLIDTHGPHLRSWVETCRRRGVLLTEETFSNSFGRRNPEVIPIYWTAGGVPVPPESEWEAIAAEKERIYRDEVETDFPLIPGALEFIDALRARGWKTAIGTSAPPENVAQALRFLGAERFDAVCDATQVKEGKPAPDVYLLAASRVEAAPSRCLVFEDAPVGLLAATRAGMRCVGLTSAGLPPEALAGAVKRIADFRGVTPGECEALVDAP